MDTGVIHLPSTSNGLLEGWQPHHNSLFGKHTMKLNHRLTESGLFTEDVLSELVDRYPRELYNLNTIGTDARKQNWREGHLDGVSGKDTIEAIKTGHLWLNLRKVMDVDKRYDDLLQSIFSEFESKIPGLKTFKQNLGILISSPKMQVLYHSDIPGQGLWQITGRKRLYVYPNTEPFLPKDSLEGLILGETQEEIPYESWFDEYAEVHDLGPGEMVLWGLNGPHRVENEDCLNISVTTEHYTSEIRKSYAVNYANGILRRRFGYTPATNTTGGLSPYAKAALTLFWKKLNLNRKREVVRMIDFVPDKSEPIGYRDIDPFVKE